jgi:hypothetical protein
MMLMVVPCCQNFRDCEDESVAVVKKSQYYIIQRPSLLILDDLLAAAQASLQKYYIETTCWREM